MPVEEVGKQRILQQRIEVGLVKSLGMLLGRCGLTFRYGREEEREMGESEEVEGGEGAKEDDEVV